MKRNRSSSLWKYSASFSVYLVVGGISAAVEWTLFFGLLMSQANYVIAALAAFLAATLINYQLSRRFAFAGKGSSVNYELAKTCLISILGLGVNLAAMILLVEIASTHAMLAKIVGTGCGFVFNYLGRQFWVFDSIPRHDVSGWVGLMRGRVAPDEAERSRSDHAHSEIDGVDKEARSRALERQR